MGKTYFFLVILLPISAFSQDFVFSNNKPCAKTNYTFTATGISSADSLVWTWNDGSTSTILSSPWEIIHRFTSSGIYDVQLQIFSGGIVTSTINKDVTVYDVPNLSIEYDAPGVVCAGQDTTIIVIQPYGMEYTDLTMEIYWGDNTTDYIDYNNLSSPIPHLYSKTSCGNSITVGGTVIKDKYLVILSAQNICTDIPELFFRQVDIKSEPNIALTIEEAKFDSTLNAYYLCEPQSITLKNPAADSNNCLSVNSTYWNITDDQGNIIDDCDNCFSSFDADFNIYSSYTINLIQDNICGVSSVETNLIVKTPPLSFFSIPELVTCFPSNIDFLNQSENTVIKSIWNFTGKEKDSIVMQGIADTSYIFEEEGEYLINLTTYDGYCYGSYDSTIILDHRCLDIYVPNAFTPNSNNPDLNVFKPMAQNLLSYRIDIYNSYGEHLWSSEELDDGIPAEGWNGTFKGQNCPAGTYIWKINAEISQGNFDPVKWDGQIYNNKDKRSKTGTFILIR